MIDSSVVNDAKTGLDLAIAAYLAISSLVGFVLGKVIKFKKKR